jgi:benzylsuccinate CoA-transferase BbsF subunit
MQLAHMGAEVIRMESMRRPCLIRSLPPWPDGQPGLNRSGYFNQYNQGKRSILLDLSKPEAIEIARKLVAISDVAVENFAGGVAERLGVGYEALKAVKPDIIMISMSGYGQTGPDAGFVSYGPAQVPLSGLSSLTSYIGYPPMHVGMSYGDPNAGLHAAFAVISSIFHRERSGEGRYIDMSQWESSLAVVAEGLMDQAFNGTQPERMGNRIQYMAPHGIYRCAGEDRWVSIAVLTEDEWAAFCGAIGRPELAADHRFQTVDDRKAHEDELDAIVEAWTSGLDRFEIRDRLQAVGVAAFPAMTNKDLAEDPHLNARSFFVEKEHPEVGIRKHAGIPWRMSGSPCEVWRAAPVIGQDNEYVYGELLGLSSAQIADLIEREIIR